VGGLLESETSRNGCTRVRAEGGIQGINVETDVDEFRQLINDPIALLLPGHAFILLAAELGTAVYAHMKILFREHAGFFLAEIAYANGDDGLHLRNGQRIVHDARMASGKTFVGIPKIEVRIQMQDAEPFIALCQGTVEAQWRAVVTTYEAY